MIFYYYEHDNFTWLFKRSVILNNINAKIALQYNVIIM